MSSVKLQVEVFLGISLALLGFWFLASGGWHKVGLLILSIMFVLSAFLLFCSLRFQPQWLKDAAKWLAKLRFGHLVLFLGLTGLAAVTINTEFWAGIALLYVAYIFFAISIGRDIGDVLRDVWRKLRRRA